MVDGGVELCDLIRNVSQITEVQVVENLLLRRGCRLAQGYPVVEPVAETGRAAKEGLPFSLQDGRRPVGAPGRSRGASGDTAENLLSMGLLDAVLEL